MNTQPITSEQFEKDLNSLRNERSAQCDIRKLLHYFIHNTDMQTEVFKILQTHDQYNKLIPFDIIIAFTLSIKAAKNQEVVDMITKHSSYKNVNDTDIIYMLRIAIKHNNEHMVEAVKDHPNYKDLPRKNISDMLYTAIIHNNEYVIGEAIQHPNYKDIEENSLASIFQDAIEHNNIMAFRHLVKHPNIYTISEAGLNYVGKHAIQNAQINNVGEAVEMVRLLNDIIENYPTREGIYIDIIKKKIDEIYVNKEVCHSILHNNVIRSIDARFAVFSKTVESCMQEKQPNKSKVNGMYTGLFAALSMFIHDYKKNFNEQISTAWVDILEVCSDVNREDVKYMYDFLLNDCLVNKIRGCIQNAPNKFKQLDKRLNSLVHKINSIEESEDNIPTIGSPRAEFRQHEIKQETNLKRVKDEIVSSNTNNYLDRDDIWQEIVRHKRKQEVELHTNLKRAKGKTISTDINNNDINRDDVLEDLLQHNREQGIGRHANTTNELNRNTQHRDDIFDNNHFRNHNDVLSTSDQRNALGEDDDSTYSQEYGI